MINSANPYEPHLEEEARDRTPWFLRLALIMVVLGTPAWKFSVILWPGHGLPLFVAQSILLALAYFTIYVTLYTFARSWLFVVYGVYYVLFSAWLVYQVSTADLSGSYPILLIAGIGEATLVIAYWVAPARYKGRKIALRIKAVSLLIFTPLLFTPHTGSPPGSSIHEIGLIVKDYDTTLNFLSALLTLIVLWTIKRSSFAPRTK